MSRNEPQAAKLDGPMPDLADAPEEFLHQILLAFLEANSDRLAKGAAQVHSLVMNVISRRERQCQQREVAADQQIREAEREAVEARAALDRVEEVLATYRQVLASHGLTPAQQDVLLPLVALVRAAIDGVEPVFGGRADGVPGQGQEGLFT